MLFQRLRDHKRGTQRQMLKTTGEPATSRTISYTIEWGNQYQMDDCRPIRVDLFPDAQRNLPVCFNEEDAPEHLSKL